MQTSSRSDLGSRMKGSLNRPSPLFDAEAVTGASTQSMTVKPLGPYAPEQKAEKLRQIGGLVGQGVLLSRAIREVGIADSTYYRWLADIQIANAPSPPEASHEDRIRRLETDFGRLWRAFGDLLIERQLRGSTPG